MEELKMSLTRLVSGGERVLVCLPAASGGGQELSAALTALGCTPGLWEGEPQWETLLRLAFDGRYRVAIGSPRVLLGLSKLSRFARIPLHLRRVGLTENCPAWLHGAIEDSLDCEARLLPGLPGAGQGDPALREREEALLRWSSVLDARLVRGSYGLELEAVVFPGKKLPAFPNCARQRVSQWEPERDIPFSILYDTKNWKNH